MVRFNCPSCNNNLMAPDEYSGRKSKCPKCGQTNVVPSPSVRKTDTVDKVVPFVEAEDVDVKKYNPSPRRFPAKPKLLGDTPSYRGVKFIGGIFEVCGWISPGIPLKPDLNIWI